MNNCVALEPAFHFIHLSNPNYFIVLMPTISSLEHKQSPQGTQNLLILTNFQLSLPRTDFHSARFPFCIFYYHPDSLDLSAFCVVLCTKSLVTKQIVLTQLFAALPPAPTNGPDCVYATLHISVRNQGTECEDALQPAIYSHWQDTKLYWFVANSWSCSPFLFYSICTIFSIFCGWDLIWFFKYTLAQSCRHTKATHLRIGWGKCICGWNWKNCKGSTIWMFMLLPFAYLSRELSCCREFCVCILISFAMRYSKCISFWHAICQMSNRFWPIWAAWLPTQWPWLTFDRGFGILVLPLAQKHKFSQLSRVWVWC